MVEVLPQTTPAVRSKPMESDNSGTIKGAPGKKRDVLVFLPST